MKLFEYLSSGRIMHSKKAKLKKLIKLDSGKSRKKGSVVSVLMDFGNDTYHIEDNDFACKVKSNEIEFL